MLARVNIISGSVMHFAFLCKCNCFGFHSQLRRKLISHLVALAQSNFSVHYYNHINYANHARVTTKHVDCIHRSRPDVVFSWTSSSTATWIPPRRREFSFGRRTVIRDRLGQHLYICCSRTRKQGETRGLCHGWTRCSSGAC